MCKFKLILFVSYAIYYIQHILKYKYMCIPTLKIKSNTKKIFFFLEKLKRNETKTFFFFYWWKKLNFSFTNSCKYISTEWEISTIFCIKWKLKCKRKKIFITLYQANLIWFIYNSNEFFVWICIIKFMPQTKHIFILYYIYEYTSK